LRNSRWTWPAISSQPASGAAHAGPQEAHAVLDAHRSHQGRAVGRGLGLEQGLAQDRGQALVLARDEADSAFLLARRILLGALARQTAEVVGGLDPGLQAVEFALGGGEVARVQLVGQLAARRKIMRVSTASP
jgi:hypothetical protein